MKKETWQTVNYICPETGRAMSVSSPGKGCPSCGQSRCTRNSPTCLAVQDAIKRGHRTYEVVAVR